MKFTLDVTGARVSIGAIRMSRTGVLSSVKSVSKVSHEFDAADDAGSDGVSDAITVGDIASGESLVADVAASVVLSSSLDAVCAADNDAAGDAADSPAGSIAARARWGNNSSTSKSTREFNVATLISLRGGDDDSAGAGEPASTFSPVAPPGGADLGGFGSGGQEERGRHNHFGPR